VIFVKQESFVLGDLGNVVSLLERRSVVLTPHLLSPLRGEDGTARDLNILISGAYNGGLVGVSGGATGRAFVEWWQDRLSSHCRHAVGEGMHYEQRWLDLVPALFDDVEILHDPGYNVGHWSFPERVVRLSSGGVSVDGRPCRLFRFSGYSADEPSRVTRYADRLAMADLGEAAQLFDRYRHELIAAGWEQTKHWPYAWDRFSNGVPIPTVVREIYLDLGEQVERFGDPFRAETPASFYHWLRAPVEGQAGGDTPVSRLWAEIHRRRPDLQQAFPDPFAADRDAYLAWTAHDGRREHDIPDELVTTSE
jgi:hypothetical protein